MGCLVTTRAELDSRKIQVDLSLELGYHTDLYRVLATYIPIGVVSRHAVL
jgi:hypothetical protein